jgi:hypothetical protein
MFESFAASPVHQEPCFGSSNGGNILGFGLAGSQGRLNFGMMGNSTASKGKAKFSDRVMSIFLGRMP